MKTLVILICVSVSASAFPQSNYALLGGSVLDPQNDVIGGAAVQLTSLSTGAIRRALTNAQGLYQITGVLPGDYELKVEANGFGSQTRKLRLEVGQQLTLDVSLKLASVSSSVDVKTEMETLRTTDPSVGEVIEPAVTASFWAKPRTGPYLCGPVPPW